MIWFLLVNSTLCERHYNVTGYLPIVTFPILLLDQLILYQS